MAPNEENRVNVELNEILKNLSGPDIERIKQDTETLRLQQESPEDVSCLPTLERHGPFDAVFIDADKASYPDYYEATASLVAPGGLLLVDNIFGSSAAWIDDLAHPDAAATDRMNRRAAADDRFDSAGVFVRAGLLVARRRPGA